MHNSGQRYRFQSVHEARAGTLAGRNVNKQEKKMTQKKNSLIQLGMAAVVVSSLALSACKEETASVSGADTAALKERLESAEEQAGALKKELEELKNQAKEQKKEAEAVKKENENELVELQKKLREAKKTKSVSGRMPREWSWVM